MNYPVWEPFAANSLIIAFVAIIHVFVSHFAIGGGLYLVLAEIRARRKNDQEHLNYVRRHSKFFMLLTVVFGAATGVGIWITIGLIHPVGTKWLINNFVWGWATEWVAFFVEIAAIIIYYYGWQRLSPKVHLAVGWIYFIAAWASLFVINGIIGFMLTPGEWLLSGNFWDGFFNPTFWPSLFFRTFICLMLAGLYATLTVAKEKNIDLKTRIMRFNGLFIIVPMILLVPSGLWYYNALPASVTAAFVAGSTPMIATQIMIVAAAVLLLLSFLSNIIFPRHSGYISAGILLLLGLIAMGGFEWTREAIRKPFVIYDFLYSNNQLVTPTDYEKATLPRVTTGNRGRDLYLTNCRSCHTLSGYKSLSDRLAGLEEEHIANIIPRLQHYFGPMPPFGGDADDAKALASYLITIADPDPLTGDNSQSDENKAKIVFGRRCGGCHTLNGARPLGESFADMDGEEIAEIIGAIEDLADEMPPFTGSNEELRLLTEYLKGGGK
ncbi:MAG: hypothetical protein GY841_19370 [FCB group bacterium]|nr:hypothetical protein [FCB group bacterium]